MGNLIKVLTRDIDHNASPFFLDFESKFNPSQLVYTKYVLSHQSEGQCRILKMHVKAGYYHLTMVA